MVNILSLIGIAGQMGQIATSLLQSKNFLINTEMRAEQLRNTVLNHEQQLKMFHLQQEYKLRDFKIDNFNKLNQETYKASLDAHKNRLIECKVPFYPQGSWKYSRFSNQAPAPFIIIATNTYQGDSSFKNDDIIKPLHKVYQSLKEYNHFFDGSSLTITDTRQYFNGDEDARVFFRDELNCPAIIVYSYFTGSTLNIRVLYSGITNHQNLPNTNKRTYEFEPKFMELWTMDFTFIHSLKVKKSTANGNNNEQPVNPYQWKKNLDNLIETFVGIKIQSLIDEYFQNSYTYTPQSIKYLNDRKEKYSRAVEWKEFESEVVARYDIINKRKFEFQEDYHKRFLSADKVLIRIAIFGMNGCGKSALINSIFQKDIANVGFGAKTNEGHLISAKPPFEITEVHLSVGCLIENEALKIAESTDLHILLICDEPFSFEIDLFNDLYEKFPAKTRIVFVNKSDIFERIPKKYVIVKKEHINKKMSKYVSGNEDIIFGAASLYDAESDMMIRSDNLPLQERIYKEVLILNKLNG